MNGAVIWSQFDFENREALAKRDRHIIVWLMKLIDDEVDVNVDVEELYKVTTPCNNRWFIVQCEEGPPPLLVEDVDVQVPCPTAVKVMFAVITQPRLVAKLTHIQRVTPDKGVKKTRRNRRQWNRINKKI
jgi:hypothetical protein